MPPAKLWSNAVSVARHGLDGFGCLQFGDEFAVVGIPIHFVNAHGGVVVHGPDNVLGQSIKKLEPCALVNLRALFVQPFQDQLQFVGGVEVELIPGIRRVGWHLCQGGCGGRKNGAGQIFSLAFGAGDLREIQI